MIWFTSDHHFGHTNIIKYCDRPFDSVEEMDSRLISNWNEKVDDNDTVYYLGDFTLRSDALQYIVQLKGRIHFVPGGHDNRWLRKLVSTDSIIAEKHFLISPLGVLKFSDCPPIVICHYPMLSWEQSHYGSIHLHGHSHNTLGTITNSGDIQLPPKDVGGKNGKRMDVGVDAHNFYPVSLDDVLEKLLLL